jgi:peptidoglycan/LPS O-acetylase OafA/YrhL
MSYVLAGADPLRAPVDSADRLVHLEGLRAWLALWVALGHGLQTSGYLTLSGAKRFLLAGDAAVHVFVILSGFVITHLLLGKAELYLEYLWRRFWRLYPAFLICCLIGYLIMGGWKDMISAVAWAGDPYWAPYKSSVAEIADQTLGKPIEHGVLHLTMLHGLIPTELLPRAPMTYLPAAWSISLEWQFYLVAPLVIYLVGTGGGYGSSCLGVSYAAGNICLPQGASRAISD